MFDLMGADPALKAARKVWSWIRREQKRQFTFRDAYQALRGGFPRGVDLDPAFGVLEERSYIRSQTPGPQSGPGRPSRTYEVNPTLAEQWRSL